MLMIRLFVDLCKCFHAIKNNDDYELYCSYTDHALMDRVSCPVSSCHAKGSFHNDGSYVRLFVCYTDSQVKRHHVTVPRQECNSCGHSHALLAPVIVPYSPFSFHFVISLLYEYITNKCRTVRELCQKYDISVSTLYRILHRFLDDRKRMLGMMQAAISRAQELLVLFLGESFTDQTDCRLRDYFLGNGFSFLQARCRLRLRPVLAPGSREASP